jgi:hypothetical protein
MLNPSQRFSAILKHAVLAFVVFSLFATATAVFAEQKTFGPCNSNAKTYRDTQDPTLYHGWTERVGTGCTWVWLTMREWVGSGSNLLSITNYADAQSLATSSLAGQSSQPWFITSRHQVDGSNFKVRAYTSHDGLHSSCHWFTNGTGQFVPHCW